MKKTNKNASVELAIAQEAVRNLWQITNYQTVYINYLLGGMSKKEFKSRAKSFVQEKNQLSSKQLLFSVSYIKALLPDVEFDGVADILNVEYEDLVDLKCKREIVHGIK